MKQTEGRYQGHPWFWYSDFGVYVCETASKTLCADMLDDLYKLIDESEKNTIAKRSSDNED